MCIILQKNPVDHITDHLPFRSTRKQWTGERRRARFSERKGAEKVIFSGNCPYRFVWDHQAAGSIPVTRTKILTESRVYSPLSVIFYAYLGISPPLLKNAFLRPHKQIWTGNFFFFAYSGAEFEKSNEQPPRIFPWRYCIHLTPSVRI